MRLALHWREGRVCGSGSLVVTIEDILHFYPVLSGIVIGVVALLGFGIKWMNSKQSDALQTINAQRVDDIKIHDGTHALQDARFITVEHKALASEHAITALTAVSSDHAMRVARLETSVDNFKEGQVRIERGQESIKSEMKDNFNQLAASIREIRRVSVRPEERE